MARETLRLEVDARDLERSLRRFGRSGETAVARAAHDSAAAAGDRARATVPVRSGRLRGSIAVERDHDGARLEMGAGVPYAGWIEYGGTRGRAYVPEGRYVGRATAHADKEFAQRTERALDQIARQL